MKRIVRRDRPVKRRVGRDMSGEPLSLPTYARPLPEAHQVAIRIAGRVAQQLAAWRATEHGHQALHLSVQKSRDHQDVLGDKVDADARGTRKLWRGVVSTAEMRRSRRTRTARL